MDDLLSRAGARVRTDAEHQLTGRRRTIGARGLLAIAFGAALLIWPAISLHSLTLLFGACSLFYGSMTVASALGPVTSRRRLWLMLLAMVDFAAGIAVIVWPNVSALVLLYVIGAWAIGNGILLLTAPFWIAGLSDRGDVLLPLGGLVSIVFGIVMLARPGDGALALLALIAAFAIVSGVLLLAHATGVRRPPTEPAERRADGRSGARDHRERRARHRAARRSGRRRLG